MLAYYGSHILHTAVAYFDVTSTTANQTTTKIQVKTRVLTCLFKGKKNQK